MKVSSDEMYVDGSYLKNNPTWNLADASWKADFIFNMLKKNNLHPDTVAEVGCGAGGILEQLALKDLAIRQLAGFDISPQAIMLAKSKQTERVRFYNEDFLTATGYSCDLLLVVDVLEHVDDFYHFLRSVKGRSRHYIFHIPLDLSCRTILKPHVLLQQRSSVGHIHYFTKDLVDWMLNDTGYELIDWHYTKPAVDVKRAATVKQYIKKMLRSISYAVNKDLSARLWGGYSMLILAK